MAALTAGFAPAPLEELGCSNATAEIEHNPAVEDLERRLNEALQQSQYRQLGKLVCRVEGGNATLRGIVSSFYLKQMAQEQTARAAKIRVVNLVEVVDL